MYDEEEVKIERRKTSKHAGAVNKYLIYQTQACQFYVSTNSKSNKSDPVVSSIHGIASIFHSIRKYFD